MSEKKLLSESAIRRLMKYANLDQATAEEFMARNAIQEEDSSQELELDAAADLDDANADLEGAADDLADATADIESAEDDLVAAAEAPMDEDQVEALVDAVLSAISDVTGVEAEVVSDVAAAELDSDADAEMMAMDAEEVAAADDDALELVAAEPELAEDTIDTEIGHLRKNTEDDKEHIDNLEKDIDDDREEERRGEHARTNEAALVARVTRRVAERLLKTVTNVTDPSTK
jgi:hypothetical protein